MIDSLFYFCDKQGSNGISVSLQKSISWLFQKPNFKIVNIIP